MVAPSVSGFQSLSALEVPYAFENVDAFYAST